jgi:hypothetical protein
MASSSAHIFKQYAKEPSSGPLYFSVFRTDQKVVGGNAGFGRMVPGCAANHIPLRSLLVPDSHGAGIEMDELVFLVAPHPSHTQRAEMPTEFFHRHATDAKVQGLATDMKAVVRVVLLLGSHGRVEFGRSKSRHDFHVAFAILKGNLSHLLKRAWVDQRIDAVPPAAQETVDHGRRRHALRVDMHSLLRVDIDEEHLGRAMLLRCSVRAHGRRLRQYRACFG